MLKTIFVFGIVAGFVVVSAKACDGPIDVPGYIAGSCNPVNNDTTSGTGSCQPSSGTIGYRNDYNTCGGDGYASCSVGSQTVGRVNPGCVATYSIADATIAMDAYIDCKRINNGGYTPPIQCTYEFSQFNTCSMATSGGTPITADVENYLGEYYGEDGCHG